MDAAVQVPSLRPQDRRVSVCRAPKIPTASYVRYGGITWMQAAISGFAVMSVCGWLEILERKPTGLLVVAIGLLLQAVPVFGQPGEQLQLVQTIALPDVRGRIDHLDIDLDGSRLFVAALGNNSVEVIDLRSGRRSASLEHLREPQGVAYVPREKSLFIASGGSGRVAAFEGNALAVVGHVEGLADADNVRYEPASGRVANVPIGGDVDDLFFDAERNRVYAICGEGVITVVQQQDTDRYAAIGQVRTAPDARTGLFVAPRRTLYVAVPAQGARSAEIRVYNVK